jgi:hypothetical protein
MRTRSDAVDRAAIKFVNLALRISLGRAAGSEIRCVVHVGAADLAGRRVAMRDRERQTGRAQR